MQLDELQKAIYARLASQVSGSFVGIYTDVPQPDDSELDSAFPYLTIGPVAVSNIDTKSDDGISALAQVHVWHRTNSTLAVRALYNGVYAALQDYRALAVTGANVVNCLFEGADEFDDPDGKTKHGVMRFRVDYFLT